MGHTKHLLSLPSFSHVESGAEPVIPLRPRGRRLWRHPIGPGLQRGRGLLQVVAAGERGENHVEALLADDFLSRFCDLHVNENFLLLLFAIASKIWRIVLLYYST